MKILVTGGYGQVGSELVKCLRSEGHTAVGLGSADCDITDMAMVTRCLGDDDWGAIVNCAAYTDVDRAESQVEQAFAVNRDGPANLAAAAASSGIPLIHLSTDFVFDGGSPHPYREQDAVAPVNVYGASKLAGEAAVRAALKAHVLIRTSWVFGVVGRNFVKSIIAAAGTRTVLEVVDDQVGVPTAAGHLAVALAALLNAIERGWCRWGTYHLTSNGEPVSRRDFAAAILDELQARGHAVPMLKGISTRALASTVRRPSNSHLDCSLFEATFPGLRPHWRVGLDHVMAVICGQEKNQ